MSMLGKKMRNIILITADSIRADHCSFMGYKRETTPNLDKMAKNGICFENAYAPGSRTLSSMTSIFTGDLITQYIKCDSEESFGKNGRFNLKMKRTLAEVLSEKGYTTGAFNPNAYASKYFGFDKGFDYFQDFLFDTSKFDRYIKGGKIVKIIRNIKNLITKKEVFMTWESFYEEIFDWLNNTEEPFFLWIFLLDTHFPYFVSRKYKKWGNLVDMYYINYKLYNVISKLNVNFTEEEKIKAINSYDDSIYCVDEFIGKLNKDLGGYDPLFIFHADHGEAFFERGFYGHYFPSLNEEIIKVPLVIWNGGVKNRPNKPVSLIDLYTTILNFADTGELSLSLMDKNWITSKEIDFRNGGKEIFSIRFGKWKFITGQKNMNELYNLKQDPDEQQNLINEHPLIVREIENIINRKRARKYSS